MKLVDTVEAASRLPAMEPATIGGRYVASERIGHSILRTSEVWRGVDLETGDAVALKRYQAHEELYWNEITVHTAVQIPTFARLLAHHPESFTLVKEYIPGETLASGCANIAPRTAVRVQLEVFVAAAAAGLDGDHGLCNHNLVAGATPKVVEMCNARRGLWSPNFRHRLLGTAARAAGGFAADQELVELLGQPLPPAELLSRLERIA